MAFLEDDEHLILFNHLSHSNGESLLTIDQLKQLVGFGIRTQIHRISLWAVTEQKRGEYDWGFFDKELEKARKAGMKTLLYGASYPPSWIPSDWCSVDLNNFIHRDSLSMWNIEAQEARNKFLRDTIHKYSCSKIYIMGTTQGDGEVWYNNTPTFFDRHALKHYHDLYGQEPDAQNPLTHEWLRNSYTKVVLAQSEVILRQIDRELWFFVHPAIEHMGFYIGNGIAWTRDIIRACKEELNPDAINHVYYTWMSWPGYWTTMNNQAAELGENVFGGAEYFAGLPDSTPLAIKNGLRGQIVGVCYPPHHAVNELTIGQKSIDNILHSLDLWNKK